MAKHSDADREAASILKCVALRGKWATVLSEAVSTQQLAQDWYYWFNFFDAQGRLLIDFDPVASMINPIEKRGISVHLHCDPTEASRFAQLRVLNDNVDHLMICGSFDGLSCTEVGQLVRAWLDSSLCTDDRRHELVAKWTASGST